MSLLTLRQMYHQRVCEEIICFSGLGEDRYPNFADKSSRSSRVIALGIVERIACVPRQAKLSGQRAGRLFESLTKTYLQEAFEALRHLRPGRWYYSTEEPISAFDQ